MGFTILYKLSIKETDGDLGNIGVYEFPISGAGSYSPAYRQTVDLSIADATSLDTVAQGAITTISGMVLLSSQNLTLDLDGESMTLVANLPHVSFAHSITALKVSNASGAVATLKGVIYGD